MVLLLLLLVEELLRLRLVMISLAPGPDTTFAARRPGCGLSTSATTGLPL